MMGSAIEKRLSELGIMLPDPPEPVGAYTAVIRTGNLVITSGQLPWIEGALAFTGRLGDNLTVDQGYAAAWLCAINALAQLRAAVGNLDRIRQIVRLEGYLQCTAGFQEHPQVLNGASDLFNEVFGLIGRHTRTAVGIHAMPLNAPVQLVVWAELASGLA